MRLVIQFFFPGAALLLMLALFAGAALLIDKAVDPAPAPPLSRAAIPPLFSEEGYAPALEVGFGEAPGLVGFERGEALFRVSLSGFTAGRPFPVTEGSPEEQWPRHLYTRHDGTIRIQLRRDRADAPSDLGGGYLSVLLIDDPWQLRNVRLRTRAEERIASMLHPGRWIHLPLSPFEARLGDVALDVRPFTGDGALVSRLVLHLPARSHDR